ncbi:MAG: T9SS type A sorting domain-containing protein [Lewinellaceae bacterium]|nr:T9SS type A sorting domain-containing protein [Lewinellaceae bacterium]
MTCLKQRSRATALSVILFFLFTFQTNAQQAGTPDPGFGDAGRVVESLGRADGRGYGIAFQPDGKVVVAGESFAGDGAACLVVRLLADGSPDPAFGQNGRVFFRPLNHSFLVYDIALQTDGALLVCGAVTNYGVSPNVTEGCVLRLLSDGTPDATFGDGGLARILVNNRPPRFEAIRVLGDGKILLAGLGFSQSGGAPDGLVARLLTNGSLDNTFGDNGATVIPLSTGTDYLNQIHVQTTGDILTTGYQRVTGVSGFINAAVAVRLSADGMPDPNYGTAGVAIFSVANVNIASFNSVLLPDNSVVLGGYALAAGNRDLLLLRFKPDGQPDSTFGTNGATTLDAGPNDAIIGLALLPNGKLAAAGYYLPANSSWTSLLAQFNADGTPDNTFGTNGVRTGFYPGLQQSFFDLKVQADGSLVTTGFLNSSHGADLTVSRFNPDGSPDTQFGAGGQGLHIVDVAGGDNFLTDLALDADGNIYTTHIAAGDNEDGFIVKYQPNGTRAADFGQNGQQRLPELPLSSQEVQALAVQPDGKIVAAGQLIQFGLVGATDSLTIWRQNPDGTPDPGFGQNGLVRIALPDQSVVGVYDLTLQNNGKILLCGRFLSEVTGQFHALVIRLTANGMLDPVWGIDGVLWIYSPANAQVFSVRPLPDANVLVAGLLSPNFTNDIFITRLLPNGAPDPTFGASGIVTVETNDVSEVAFDLHVYADGRFLVAANLIDQGGDRLALLAYRFMPDGSPDNTFGTNGRVELPAGTFWSSGLSLVYPHASLDVQADGKIVLTGIYNDGSDGPDIALYRLFPDGSLDTDFGNSGLATADIFGFADYASGVTVQSDNKILVSGFGHNGEYFEGVVLRFLPGLVIGTQDLAPDNKALFVYPNPIVESARLTLEQDLPGAVQVYLENLQGARLGSLFNGYLSTGTHNLDLQFDAQLPAGNYICRVVSPGGQAVIRIQLVR